MERKTSINDPNLRLTPLRAHRRQALWQIWLPLAFAILITLALMAFAVYGAVVRSPAVDKWGAIASIYVIIPVLFISLAVIALVGGIIYLLGKLLKKIPDWAVVVHRIVIRAGLLVHRVLDAVVKPVIAVSNFSARTETLLKRIFH